MSRAGLALAAALVLTACTTETVVKQTTVKGTALDHGKALFSDPSASPSTSNAYSCATCHQAEADPESDKVWTGAALAGVTERPTYWGGQENDLLRSINHCRYYFMGAQQAWTADDEEAKAMYAYLVSLPRASTEPAPFTVVSSIDAIPKGDAKRGEGVYQRACEVCHGAAHTGAGRIAEHAVKLPDQTLADHATYSAADQRLVFVEKARHGTFLGYGGTMPPFSKEVLSDTDLGDLLTYFGLDK